MFILDQKYKNLITTHNAFVLFIASLGVLTAFVAMMYFDQRNQPTYNPTIPPSTSTLSADTSNTTTAINNLTSQLMTERQLTNELNAQNERLKSQLEKNLSDDSYLSSLEAIHNNKINGTQNKKIETTDYYNKVSLNNNSQNLLQSQINQFIESKDKEKTIYLESLKVESKIRNNEVRSIILKKGESIWMLAKRAYGDGFLYHKIMKANPQITEKNAKLLKPGTIIRVPL